MSLAKDRAEQLLLLVELRSELAEKEDWTRYSVIDRHIEEQLFVMAISMARELTREEGSD